LILNHAEEIGDFREGNFEKASEETVVELKENLTLQI
jgi:hypothetical protein